MDSKNCSMCNTEKPLSNFYKVGGIKPGYKSRCKKCHTQVTTATMKKFKVSCVEYKGGKCIICGYDKCISALEFHHRDPSQKEFAIAKARKSGFTDRVKSELDKCDLLCANCHREVHESMIAP